MEEVEATYKILIVQHLDNAVKSSTTLSVVLRIYPPIIYNNNEDYFHQLNEVKRKHISF